MSSFGKQSSLRTYPMYRFGSARARPSVASSKRCPGPGAYNCKSDLGRTAHTRKDKLENIKFGKSKRGHNNYVNSVGPGEYNVEGAFGKQMLRTKEPSWKFPKTERMKDTGSNSYLPPSKNIEYKGSLGQQISSSISSAPVSSISGRESFGSTVQNSCGPGPAAYAATSAFGNQVMSTKRSYQSGAAVGTSRRDGLGELNDAPGPGAYSLPTSIGASVTSDHFNPPSFSLRGRETFGSVLDTKSSSNLPGPGAYTIPQPREGPKHKIAGKWKVRGRWDKKPGPGTYRLSGAFGSQALSTKISYNGNSLGKSTRSNISRPQTSNIGPGQYEINGTFGNQATSVRASTPQYSFGKQKRYEHVMQKALEMQLNNIKNNRPATAMGKQVLSHTRSAPSFSMSGRTKFGGFI